MPVFMKLGDIKGESLDSKHRDWIAVDSFKHDLAQPAPGSSAPGGPNRAVHGDFTITKTVDKATPLLMKLCADGNPIPQLQLACRKAGGEQQDYLLITLTDVQVSSFKPDNPGSECAVSEQVSFNYSKIEWKYTAPDGEVVTADASRTGPPFLAKVSP